jgi:fructose-1,6-bisphosphatase/inositol monophosphatase family enzyme
MSDANVAINAVRAGAAVVHTRSGTMLDRIDKGGGGDFATGADMDSESAMGALIRPRCPDDLITGEEIGSSGPFTAERRWLIDPPCGTLNSAAGTPAAEAYAALVTGQEATAAAVAAPFSGQVFWTDGERACGRDGELDRPLFPTSSSRLVDLHLDPPCPNREVFGAATLAFDPELASFRTRVGSSSLALTWVATGQRAAYVADGDVRHSVRFAAGLGDAESRFLAFVLSNEHNRVILDRAAALDLPDWWLTAGAVYQSVWNGLDGRPASAGILDYDLFYFDEADRSAEAEARANAAARELFSDLGVVVEVRNEARVHLWYEQEFGVPGRRFESSCDAVDHFAATTCCFAITRQRGGELEIYAPHGFGDLLGQRIRPNPALAPREVYETKVARWVGQWPTLEVEPWPGDRL